MDSIPLISVIVPCFNQGEFLEECVNSVLSQTFVNWECIIIDDGSTDETKSISIRLSEKDSRIKYLSKKNGGLSHTRNFGIQNARGEYILPLDADDYLSDNYLQIACNKLTESSLIKVVYGVVRNFGAINEWGANPIIFNYQKQLYYNQIHCAGLYRREDALGIIGYDENMKLGFEDWEFYIRLLGDGGTAIQISEIVLFYRRKEKSMLQHLTNDNNKITVTNYIAAKNLRYYNDYQIDLLKAVDLQYKLVHPEEFYSYRFIVQLIVKKIAKTIKFVFQKKNE